MEEKQGTITEIVFHNEENGYTIAIFETDEEYFTIVGNLPVCHVGTRYKLEGSFKVHPTYGEQFAFTRFEELLPTDKESIENFLSSGVIKGVGSKTAKLIVEAFGEKTLEVLEKSPVKLSMVKGIGLATANKIAESYAAHIEFAKVAMYLHQYDVSAEYTLKLYKQYGKEVVKLIEENPYRLAEDVRGVNFKKADAMAMKMGISEESPYRIKSCIKYVLLYFVGEGNTYTVKDVLLEKVNQLIEVSLELINDNLVEMAFEGDIKVDNIEGEEAIYIYSYYAAEQRVCRDISILSQATVKALSVDIENLIRQNEVDTGKNLSPQQREAVKGALIAGVSVITGGPGTGKTTIINTIINILERNGIKTAIAAPTGRAAKRITETSGHYASTVHRLLEYYYDETTDSMKFGKYAESPLDYEAIIIDEASMIDLMLMEGLTQAIKPGSRLIIVGDSDQLPSVGAGNVLRDLIDSEYVQVFVLNEIFRQAVESYIVVNAHRINRGEYPFLNEKFQDFYFMERNSDKDIADLIIQLVTRRLSNYYDNVVPIKDIQVLTPMRKGNLGCVNLNKLLQRELNPPREGVNEQKYGEKIFRENDKVMQIRNNYQIGWRKKRDFSEGEGIFNGDVGFIEKIDKEEKTVTVLFDEDKLVTYELKQLDELELAYAVTVHKSQGSEFPIVVMPIAAFPPMLATRNLLYTAITRAEDLVVLVGMQSRLNGMIDNNRIKQRYSGLKERLKNAKNFEEGH